MPADAPVRRWALAALAVGLPWLGAFGDPLGADAFRVAFLAALGLVAIACARPLVPGLRGVLFLAALATTALPGLRGLSSLASMTPVLLGVVIAWAAASERSTTGRNTIAGAILLGGAGLAAWGIADALGGGRGVVALGNANRVGEFACAVAPFAAVAFLLGTRGVGAVGFVTLLLLLGQLIIAQSRGGLAVVTIELCVATWIACKHGPTATRPGRRAGAVALAVLAIGALLWAIPQTRHRVDHAIERVTRGISPEYPSNRVRWGVARQSAKLALATPLGTGAGTFEDAFVPWRDPTEHRISGWASTVPDAHDQYLHSAVEAGWLGGLAVLLTWIALFRLGGRRRDEPPGPPALDLLAVGTPVLAVGLAVYAVVGTPLQNAACVAVLALAAGSAASARAATKRPAIGTAAWLALIAVTVGLGLWSVREVRSQRARIEAASLLAAANADRAASRADKLRTMGDLLEAWRRAADLTPEHWRIHDRIGAYERALGRSAAALAAFDAGIAAAPHAIAPRLGAAASLQRLDRPSEALARIEPARRDQPWNPLVIQRHAPIARRVAAALTREAIAAKALAPAFHEILETDPDQPEAHDAIVAFARATGDDQTVLRHRYLAHVGRAKQNARQAVDFMRRRPPTTGWERLFEKAIRELKRATMLKPSASEPAALEAAIRALRDRPDAPYHDRDVGRAMWTEAVSRGFEAFAPRDALFTKAIDRYRDD